MSQRDPSCDVLVVGGGLGGVAAALAATRRGFKVLLTEETDWIGGQLTAQAVPPDLKQAGGDVDVVVPAPTVPAGGGPPRARWPPSASSGDASRSRSTSAPASSRSSSAR